MAKRMRQGLRKMAKFYPQPTPDDSPINEALMRLVAEPERRVGPKPAEPEKPRNPLPQMRPAVFRMPTEGYVSPQDGTPVRCNTGTQEFVDDHGNKVQLQDLARGRQGNKIIDWIVGMWRA